MKNRTLLYGLALCFSLLAAFPAYAGTLNQSQFQQIRIGQSESAVLKLLGTPDRKRIQGKSADLLYGNVRIALKNHLVQEIERKFSPPIARAEAVSPELLVIELPRERIEDTVLPGRRFAHPSTGRIWVIGMHGKVESLRIQSAWKTREKGDSIEKLLDGPPPGENITKKRTTREPASVDAGPPRNSSCADCLIVQTNQTEQQAEDVLQSSEPLTECPEPGTLELEQARRDHAALFGKSSATIEVSVAGGRVRGSAEEVAIFKELLSGTHPPSKWPEGISECPLIKSAFDVRCALTALFGSEESALRAFNIAKRSGYFVSLSQQMNPDGVEQIWTSMEVRAIDHGLQALPSRFQNLKTFKRFYRVQDSYVYCEKIEGSADCKPMPNTAATAHSGYARTFGYVPGFIAMYWGAFKTGYEYGRQTVIHEMAHQLDYTGYVDSSEPLRSKIGFEQLSWEPEPGKTRLTTPLSTACFASEYASTNSTEDFAETVENYFADPEAFREKCETKFNWIKTNFFGGQEEDLSAWPAMTRVLGGPDAKANTVLSLFKCLRYIGPSKEGQKPVIWQVNPANPDSFKGRYHDAGLRTLPCSITMVKEVIGRMSSSERDEACMLREQGINRAFYRESGPMIDGMLDLAFAHQENPPALTCAPKRAKPDPTCFWTQFAQPNFAKNPALNQISGTKQRELSDQLHRLLYDDPFWYSKKKVTTF